MYNKEYAKLFNNVLIMVIIYGFIVGGIIDMFNIDLSHTDFVKQLEGFIPAIKSLHVNNKHPALAISLWAVLLISIIPITFFSILYFREKIIERLSLGFIIYVFSFFFLFFYVGYYGLRDSLPPENSSQSYHLIHLTKSGTIFYINLLMICIIYSTASVFGVFLKLIRNK